MGITEQSSPMWLFNCLDSELGDAVLQANPGTDPRDMTEADMTLSIKQLAVKKESKLVHRIKFARAAQPPGIPIRNYLATLKGLARQYEYFTQCVNCQTVVDFSLEVIQDQLIRSLNDKDIVSDLLGDVKVDRTLAEVVEYVARKEQGKVSVEQSVDDPSSLHQTQVSTVTDTGCQSTAIYPATAPHTNFLTCSRHSRKSKFGIQH